ncbi:hypothetical protein BJ508DRAFT_419140 [Ascobolus immersus RN42]|uniref:Uncharacterized protein n=1 Tax=Ascobolus immersus RN42 TaxID=1160509 RepID=A0A3N4HGN4_ASCIM|nr:hypothetical protein BJ508DRAFT_419140 [Ascobolus immersus RN42]
MATTQADVPPEQTSRFNISNPYYKRYSNLDLRNLGNSENRLIEKFKADPTPKGFFEFAVEIAILVQADILDELERHWADSTLYNSGSPLVLVGAGESEWNTFRAKRWGKNVTHLETELSAIAERLGMLSTANGGEIRDIVEHGLNRVKEIFAIGSYCSEAPAPRQCRQVPGGYALSASRLSEEYDEIKKETSEYWGGQFVPTITEKNSVQELADMLLDLVRFNFSETIARASPIDLLNDLNASGDSGIWDLQFFAKFKQATDKVVLGYDTLIKDQESKGSVFYKSCEQEYGMVSAYCKDGIHNPIQIHYQKENDKRADGTLATPTNKERPRVRNSRVHGSLVGS